MAGALNWYQLDLGDAMLAESELARLIPQLKACPKQSATPELCIAAYRHQSVGMHCHLILYITEAVKQSLVLVNPVKFTRCNTPNYTDLTVIIGY
ncbi:hypothetical protein N7931_05610 [Catenovulum sp. 2E275]|uniref:hypothetical protein n=1 Tax=Catenovulum sp. 2E275 TaxID=2980497 RepID=UPI0021D2DB54|nr:hypothetical protein [Catenovulum sp. 2E275]MCU4675105.1 hypothetical protein [Catenovulum sp. 2E275]